MLKLQDRPIRERLQDEGIFIGERHPKNKFKFLLTKRGKKIGYFTPLESLELLKKAR